jgi:hypothetical protein
VVSFEYQFSLAIISGEKSKSALLKFSGRVIMIKSLLLTCTVLSASLAIREALTLSEAPPPPPAPML